MVLSLLDSGYEGQIGLHVDLKLFVIDLNWLILWVF